MGPWLVVLGLLCWCFWDGPEPREPSRAELLKTCGSRAKFRAEPRLDTPLLLNDTYGLMNLLELFFNVFSLYQAEYEFQNSNVGGK